MGGAKKKSLRQIEKQQQLRATKERKTTKTRKARYSDQTDLRFSLQDFTEEDINELTKIKVLTPFTVATKYDVKISVAKDILNGLEKRQTIQKVASSKGLKLYKFIEVP